MVDDLRFVSLLVKVPGSESCKGVEVPFEVSYDRAQDMKEDLIDSKKGIRWSSR